MTDRCCMTCKWAVEHPTAGPRAVYCEFPLPYWIKRELLHPLTGGGALANAVLKVTGEDCPTWEEAQ